MRLVDKAIKVVKKEIDSYNLAWFRFPSIVIDSEVSLQYGACYSQRLNIIYVDSAICTHKDSLDQVELYPFCITSPLMLHIAFILHELGHAVQKQLGLFNLEDRYDYNSVTQFNFKDQIRLYRNIPSEHHADIFAKEILERLQTKGLL